MDVFQYVFFVLKEKNKIKKSIETSRGSSV
jgi:hypothetical protein